MLRDDHEEARFARTTIHSLLASAFFYDTDLIALAAVYFAALKAKSFAAQPGLCSATIGTARAKCGVEIRFGGTYLLHCCCLPEKKSDVLSGRQELRACYILKAVA